MNQSLTFLLFSCFFFCIRVLSFSQSLDSVKIGNGGGFSGNATVYKISGKKISKSQGRGTPVYTQEAKLPCKAYRHIRKQGQALWKEAPFNQPSNTYKWIELYSQGKSSKFVWGDPQFTPPNTVSSYYEYINQLIPTLTFK